MWISCEMKASYFRSYNLKEHFIFLICLYP